MSYPTRLIQRAGKYGTSKSEMVEACERYAGETDCKFVGLEKSWKWAYIATFKADDGEFSGVMISVQTDDPDWPEEADVVFGHGQMVGLHGQHVIEEDEYYCHLGIGE